MTVPEKTVDINAAAHNLYEHLGGVQSQQEKQLVCVGVGGDKLFVYVPKRTRLNVPEVWESWPVVKKISGFPVPA